MGLGDVRGAGAVLAALGPSRPATSNEKLVRQATSPARIPSSNHERDEDPAGMVLRASGV